MQTKEKISRQQLICLIFLAIYSIAFIFFLIFAAEHIGQLSKRRSIVIIALLPTIAVFYVAINLVINDTETIVTKIKSQNSFLNKYGYEYAFHEIVRKPRSIGIYFSKPDSEMKIILFYMSRKRYYVPYLSTETDNINIYSLVDFFGNHIFTNNIPSYQGYLELLLDKMEEDKNSFMEILKNYRETF